MRVIMVLIGLSCDNQDAGADPAYDGRSGPITASATFIHFFSPETGSLFTATDLRYDFGDLAPVPEPATMLLVGAGLAGIIRAKRQFAGRS